MWTVQLVIRRIFCFKFRILQLCDSLEGEKASEETRHSNKEQTPYSLIIEQSYGESEIIMSSKSGKPNPKSRDSLPRSASTLSDDSKESGMSVASSVTSMSSTVNSSSSKVHKLNRI